MLETDIDMPDTIVRGRPFIARIDGDDVPEGLQLVLDHGERQTKIDYTREGSGFRLDGEETRNLPPGDCEWSVVTNRGPIRTRARGRLRVTG